MKKIIKTFSIFLSILTNEQRKRGLLILLQLSALGLFEALGVFSVLPFLTVITNPNIINENKIFEIVYESFTNFINGEFIDFVILLGIFSTLTILTSAVLKMLTIYKLNIFVEEGRHNLSYRILEIYTFQNYEFYLDKNLDEMTKTILSEIDHTNLSILRPIYLMISYSFVLISLILMLMIVKPIILIISISMFLIIYGIIFVSLKNKLHYLGEILVSSNSERFKSLGELLKGIKFIKVMNLEKVFLKNFKNPSIKFANTISKHQFLNEFPNIAMEAILISSMIIISILYILKFENSNIIESFPLLGLFVFAFYRLKPTIQNVYNGITALNYGFEPISNIKKQLELEKKANREIKVKTPIENFKSLIIKDLNFKFESNEKLILKNINLEINAGDKIGIIGETGAGKTTLIDIIMGLLIPSSGNIFINNIKNNPNTNYFGYVPQNIQLIDSTIEKNIALGDKIINFEKLKNACEVSEISEFIENDLINGYKTKTGDNGIQLSGGQKQRIGIARTIYRNNQIIILDEATSALDSITEKKIINNLFNDNRSQTLIMISHNIKTLKLCDKIYILKNGEISDFGNFEQLKKNNKFFNKILNHEDN